MTTDAHRYTHGHHASVVGQHARRTAEADAAYLLPRLRPGMRLLDVGCGPGTITTGLAQAVAPGEVVGIDVAPEVLDDARAHLETTGLTNVAFEEGSVYALAYPDASFDAVHAHQVFHHLTRPVDAAREALRVLKAGGVFGVRDADWATMTHWPPTAGIDRWLALYHDVARRNGEEPDAGRRLPSWLREAGFERIDVSASTELFAERDEVLNWGDSWAERVTQSAFATQAMDYGLATRDDLEAIASAWRTWAREPDALFMYVNVECVGVKAS
jgi:ubiquinone/menaquinone biosynthesis C-methylase UbiE